MNEVNVDLYELMKVCEVEMMVDENNRIEMWMHLPFCYCTRFVKIMGCDYFDCVECLFQDSNICILNMQEVIAYFGHKVSDYKNVIDNWDEWEYRILKIESEYE